MLIDEFEEELSLFGLSFENNQVKSRCIYLLADQNINSEKLLNTIVAKAMKRGCFLIDANIMDIAEKDIKLMSPAKQKRASSTKTSPRKSLLQAVKEKAPKFSIAECCLSTGDVRIEPFSSLDVRTCKWEGSDNTPIVKLHSDDRLTHGTMFMFEEIRHRSFVLNKLIECFEDLFENSIPHFYHCAMPIQEEVYICGRICCDCSSGRINSESVILQGSLRTSLGSSVSLDLSDCTSYSIFPGQIVACKGCNPTGQKFIANEVIEPAIPALAPMVSIAHQVFVICACGPYTFGNLQYEPLQCLLRCALAEKPDVLILFGPFVTENCAEALPPDLSFDELFNHVRDLIKKTLDGTNIKVLILPSSKDVHHDFVYPQPPFESYTDRQIMMLPDPCMVTINDVVVALTSTDILMHLASEETALALTKDRMDRLIEHMFRQRSFYPLFPSRNYVPFDSQFFDRHCFIPVVPHVFILASDLKQFNKIICGCNVVNMGRLVRGNSSNTFAKILLKTDGSVVIQIFRMKIPSSK